MGRTTVERLLPLAIACALGCVLLTRLAAAQPGARAHAIAWAEIPSPVRTQLHAKGITSGRFPPYVERLQRAHERRVREGDLDHLVFYLLQSTHFTSEPPIEPALSAKALVEGLAPVEKQAFLQEGKPASVRMPAAVRSRITPLVRALDSSDPDPRLAYFRRLVEESFPDRADREHAIEREYLRAMRFLYEKEFVAQRSERPAEAVEGLYQSRGLSTDTAVEAGYLVYLGLGVARSLHPDHHVRRVLIVGPGLDLAPRTGLLETGPPESYQPWAVIDALLSLGLAKRDDLEVVAADINPRVVEHLRRARKDPPVLRLVSGIAETDSVVLSQEYRDYFSTLGRSVGQIDANTVRIPAHLAKVVKVDAAAAQTLDAVSLDVVTQRLDASSFDVVIATNVLPYFDDMELALAVSNIAAMLGPGGVFLHNDMRRSMQPIAAGAGLSFLQSRQAIIANVRGAPASLGDSVWLYRKGGN